MPGLWSGPVHRGPRVDVGVGLPHLFRQEREEDFCASEEPQVVEAKSDRSDGPTAGDPGCALWEIARQPAGERRAALGFLHHPRSDGPSLFRLPQQFFPLLNNSQPPIPQTSHRCRRPATPILIPIGCTTAISLTRIPGKLPMKCCFRL